jgi:hypothetical protein
MGFCPREWTPSHTRIFRSRLAWRRCRSDHPAAGLALLQDVPWGALSAVVDAAGGVPRHPQWAGLLGWHGAFR